MFRILNGRFIGEDISFEPPENYYIIVRRAEFSDDGVMFLSNDGSVKIIISFERDALSEEESVYDFIDEHDYKMLEDVRQVKRGTRTALGLFYGHEKEAAGAYKEFFNFYKNKYLENQITVTVELLSWRRVICNNIYEVMQLPQVKNFFNSLHYHGYSNYI